jgi:hypothetical protein
VIEPKLWLKTVSIYRKGIDQSANRTKADTKKKDEADPASLTGGRSQNIYQERSHTS